MCCGCQILTARRPVARSRGRWSAVRQTVCACWKHGAARLPPFISIERLSLGPWQAFERAIQRLFVHAGFSDVRLVGGSGDAGADVVAELGGRVWVAQAKYRGGGQLVGPD